MMDVSRFPTYVMNYLHISTQRRLDELKRRQEVLKEIAEAAAACQGASAAQRAHVCECALEYFHFVSQRAVTELADRAELLESACLSALPDRVPTSSWANCLLADASTMSLERACAEKQALIIEQLRTASSQDEASVLVQIGQLSSKRLAPGVRAFLNDFIRRWQAHPSRITVAEIDMVAELTGASPASVLEMSLQWSAVDRNALATSSSSVCTA